MLRINGSPAVRIVKLDGTLLHALLDQEDYAEARHHSWRMTGGKGSVGLYAQATQLGYQHRWVASRMGLDLAFGEVDHINGDKLDNRRANLRLVRRSANMANTKGHKDRSSPFKGVSWNKQSQTWCAYICVNYKRRMLGSYDLEDDAARAYDLAAVVAFGDCAQVNFPDRIDEPAPVRRGHWRKRASA